MTVDLERTCNDCKRPIMSRTRTAPMIPGYVRAAKGGICNTCAHKRKRANEPQPATVRRPRTSMSARRPLLATEWMHHALCRVEGDPSWWAIPYGLRGHARAEWISRAVSICDDCPVRQECLSWAVEVGEKFGILGGRVMDVDNLHGSWSA